MAVEHSADWFAVEDTTPVELQRLKLQAEPIGVVQQAAAKLSVAQNNSRRGEQRQLRGDHVVGQRPGAEENFDPLRADELAEQRLGDGKLLLEAVTAMRHRQLVQGGANFGPDAHRAGQEVAGI